MIKLFAHQLLLVLLLYAPAIAANLNLAPTQTTFLRLGRETADSPVLQSFKIGDANVNGVTIGVSRRGSPTLPLTVTLRSSQNGGDLASATIQPSQNISADPNSPTIISILFNVVGVAAGERWLVVSAVPGVGAGSNHWYLSVGKYVDGTLILKGTPQNTDLVGSVQFAAGPPPPSCDDIPLPPGCEPPPPPPNFSCEGFGCQTQGGNNGALYRVTTLADEGPGSFRDALSQGNRLIVFDVAGTIHPQADYEMLHGNITIDGCSAPSPGITLADGNNGLVMHGEFSIYIQSANVHDVIVRCLRFRDYHGDAIQIAWGAYNIVVDHVSSTGAGDGNIDVTHGAHDVTIQWSIMGDAEKSSLIKPMAGESKYTHPFGNISLHHNLFSRSSGRNPRISYGFGKNGHEAPILTADFRNNAVIEWGKGIGTDVECGGKANIINNYYRNPVRKDVPIIVRGQGDFEGCNNTQGSGGLRGFAHVSGNVSGDGINPNTTVWVKDPLPQPFNAAPVSTTDACTAAQQIKEFVGPFPRDVVDEQLVADLVLGNCGS